MNNLLGFLLILNGFVAVGQHEVRNLDLTDPSLKLLYSLRGNNLVISGIQNDSNFQVKSAYSTVNKINDSTFQLTPKSFVAYDTVYLYNESELIQSYLFVVHAHAKPKVQLGQIRSDNASIEKIKNNVELIILSNDKYITRSKIVRFELTLKNVDGKTKYKFESIEGNKMNPEMIEKIETLIEGDVLEFANIMVVDSQGIGRIFGPLEIHLVEN